MWSQKLFYLLKFHRGVLHHFKLYTFSRFSKMNMHVLLQWEENKTLRLKEKKHTVSLRQWQTVPQRESARGQTTEEFTISPWPKLLGTNAKAINKVGKNIWNTQDKANNHAGVILSLPLGRFLFLKFSVPGSVFNARQAVAHLILNHQGRN